MPNLFLPHLTESNIGGGCLNLPLRGIRYTLISLLDMLSGKLWKTSNPLNFKMECWEWLYKSILGAICKKNTSTNCGLKNRSIRFPWHLHILNMNQYWNYSMILHGTVDSRFFCFVVYGCYSQGNYGNSHFSCHVPASRQEDKSKDTLGMDVCCFQLHLKGRI